MEKIKTIAIDNQNEFLNHEKMGYSLKSKKESSKDIFFPYI